MVSNSIDFIDNPTYFADRIEAMDANQVFYKKYGFRDPNLNRKPERKGLGQKLGQLFCKSKSKHSLGSESHVSGSTIESSGPGSPRFTPDSSLSICTSSVEGD